ncbi:hypothetical protein [Kocuria sp. SM24M-10]|uniref:hypothetical protein n=1 Tax=Kocuria sp. SM24M-10 TaxID=1660349 RepID=UPI00064B4E14|nr:hypothetical protein [Kocuria sp. SM24M-10]KLU11060.1 hypothetical protein ABL57_03335 [Kocuria sp. SM24M-10]
MHHDLTAIAGPATLLDPAARAALFAALRPALEALAGEAAADPGLSAPARRVLRAVTRTRSQDTLTLTDLATRSSTAKARLPAALIELETTGYLTRLAAIAPHLAVTLLSPPSPPADSTEPQASDRAAAA